MPGVLRKLAVVCAFTCAAVSLAHAETFEASVTIHTDKPVAEIQPDIFGQFAEHLGHLMYGGLWVGPKSSIPNTRGFRNDVIAALKKVGVPVLRWPGGCFADQYHWRDGIGPRAARPVRVNTTWGGVEETNAVGTHEFLDLAEQLGAKPYINLNVGTGSPQEAKDWLEYMTSPTNSSLAQLRRKNGRAEPWKLGTVAFGNEPWGCGGHMAPEYYTDLYHRFATFAATPGDNKPMKLAAGPYDDKTALTEALMKTVDEGDIGAISLHHYALPTGDWNNKGPAIGFGEDQWASLLRAALQMKPIIEAQEAMMDKYDPAKKVALAIDEWGNWYDPNPGTNPGFLEQQNSLRDAVTAALNFNIFMAHADRIRMANIAQMVDVLQALVMTDGPRMFLTPTYFAFLMYKPFRDATALATDLTTPNYAYGNTSLPAISASAAREADGSLIVSLVDIDPHRGVHITVSIPGTSAKSVSGTVLTADAMDAHNSFDAPDTLKPVPFTGAALSAGTLTVDIPAKSVVVLTLH